MATSPSAGVQISELITESPRKTATSSLKHRAEAWAEEAPAFHKALETLPCVSTRKFVGLNAWGERLLYRLKLRVLNLFVRSASRPVLFVLFFDGGSRGNPGPGGSGSVLLQVDPRTGTGHPLWFASMAYGDNRTTNNMAEYLGLLHGLLRAKKTGLHHIHVVGDSMMIINQLQGRRPPLAAKLTRLYCHCRITANHCAVQSWTHHCMTHNKTADALANLAMDSKVSRQVSSTGQNFPTGCWDGALRNVPHDLSE